MAKKKVQKKVPVKAKKIEVQVKKPTPGVYVYKPIRSIILECSCGNKYIATRPKQRTCLDCVKEQMLAAR